MIPDTLAGWVYLLVACGMGLFLGHWIRARRNKANTGDVAATWLRKEKEYIDKHSKKKAKKKNRKLGRKER